MSFDNDYPNRKDWRKPYYGHKAFDPSCRPGGDCPWCIGNRRGKQMDQDKRKRLEAAGWVFANAEDFLELTEEERKVVKEHRARVRAAMEKVALIHRAALKELAE